MGRISKQWLETRFGKPGCPVTVYDGTIRSKDMMGWPMQCAQPAVDGSVLGLCEKHEADRQRLK